jgi:hypothetical protein
MTPVTVVEQAAVELYFDYSTVPEAHRDTLRRSAITIKPRLKRAAEDIFVIGRELRSTKTLLVHGQYTHWLDVEFGLSERMAQRFVSVYERLGAKSDIMSDLPPTTLYLLAAPSTPDEAIETVEKQLDTGDRISVAYVQRVITEARQKARQPTPDGPMVEGVVTDSQNGAAAIVDRKKVVQRLDDVLASVVMLLGEQAVADWDALLQTDDLRRVRAELMRLKAALHQSARSMDETA